MRCIIFGASSINDFSYIKINKDDYIICADGGYNNFLKSKNNFFQFPHLVLGDFDSLNIETIPKNVEIKVFSEYKDETDIMLALNEGMSLNFNNFVIYGGLGGRIDHQYANIQLLKYTLENNAFCNIIDQNNILFMVSANFNNNVKLLSEKYNKYNISIFSYTDYSILSTKNLFYELDDTKILNNFPIGISNKIKNINKENFEITIKLGIALIILSKE